MRELKVGDRVLLDFGSNNPHECEILEISPSKEFLKLEECIERLGYPSPLWCSIDAFKVLDFLDQPFDQPLITYNNIK